jgi:phosphatidylglycerophosphate synthase
MKEKLVNKYTYNCVDDSILLPHFKKYYVSLYFRLVPRGLTANLITLLSTGFIFFLLYIVHLPQQLSSGAMAGIIAFCLHNYLVGDHLDGMQAKETQTSSPLGEFLDHYLDVYNGAIVFFVLAIFLRPIPDDIFYVLLVLNCIAFAATMMEELERGELYFGKIGTLEAVVLLFAFFISWMAPPIREFWQKELLWGYSLYWLVIVLFGLGLVFTLVDIFKRLGRIPAPFALYFISLVLLSVFLYLGKQDRLAGWLVLVLYSGEYIGKIMNSYFQAGKHRLPDLVVPVITGCLIGLVVFQVTDLFLFSWLNWFLFAYLVFKVVWIFTTTFYELKAHWHWWNPV